MTTVRIAKKAVSFGTLTLGLSEAISEIWKKILLDILNSDNVIISTDYRKPEIIINIMPLGDDLNKNLDYINSIIERVSKSIESANKKYDATVKMMSDINDKLLES